MTPRQLHLLTLITTYEGELDAEALADLAVPRPPLTGTAAYLAWRSVYAAERRQARADVTRDLGALVKAGLVARLQPVRLADGVLADVYRHGAAYRGEWRSFTRFVGRTRQPTKREAWDLGVEAVVRNALSHDSAEMDTAIRLFRRVVKGPTSPRKLLGRSPSGGTKRAYAMLCDAGLLVPPSRRAPTPEGRATVARMRGCA